MSGEPLFALPPRVLVAGRLQCGAARAGVRRAAGVGRVCGALAAWRTWRARRARGSRVTMFSGQHHQHGDRSRFLRVGHATSLANEEDRT